MKTNLLLLSLLFTLALSAQEYNTQARVSIEKVNVQRTNGQAVITYEVVEQVTRLLMSAVAIQTNVIGAQKPLLSTQQPPPKIPPAKRIDQVVNSDGSFKSKPVAKIPGVTVPLSPPSNSIAYVDWVIRNNYTNAPAPVPINSPQWRKWAEWKKTAK